MARWKNLRHPRERIGGASLETSNLSLGCLRFFRLALFPVLDPLCLFPPQFKICQYEFTAEAFYVLLVFFFWGVGVGEGVLNRYHELTRVTPVVV